MRKFVCMCFVVLWGLVFIFEPVSGRGFVFWSASDVSSVVILDGSTQQARFYRLEGAGEVSLRRYIDLLDQFVKNLSDSRVIRAFIVPVGEMGKELEKKSF